MPQKSKHQPHENDELKYGAKVQYAKEEDTADPVSKEDEKKKKMSAAKIFPVLVHYEEIQLWLLLLDILYPMC